MDGIVHISVQNRKILCNRPNKTYSILHRTQAPATSYYTHMARLLEPSGFLDLVHDPVPDIASDLDLALIPRQVWANDGRGASCMWRGGGGELIDWWVELIRLGVTRDLIS